MSELDVAALPEKAAFAAANGWTYTPAGIPDFTGSMFDYLQGATTADVFRTAEGARGPRTEVGLVTGTVAGGQAWPGTNGMVRTTFETNERYTMGYLAIQLDAALPQYVLDAKRNDAGPISSIIMPIAGGQIISLEGDFDSHFTLYGPKGYERDARYVFTPDLMGLLIDETGDFDVEIVDDRLYVYARGGWDLASATLWRRLSRIRDVVGAKALRQTMRYSDERPPVEGGRRLRLGLLGSRSKVGVIFLVALVVATLGGVLGMAVLFLTW